VFYTLTISNLQDLLRQHYKGGRRPKNPTSTHCALWPKHIAEFEGWAALERVLRGEA
jgi:hypothetical protein